MPRIQSIQIGRIISEGDPAASDVLQRQWTTAFYKMPAAGPLRLTTLGLAGDSVADTRHHGGPEKAVLCYSADHYRLWADEHPELGMSPGALGENLTIAGADETNVCIGDRYQCGDCEIEVSQPRQPCWKISRRWGVKTLTNLVAQTGRTGWYARVITEGMLEIGQELVPKARPNPNWTIARANDIMFGREVDRMAVVELMSLAELSDQWKSDIS